MSLIIYVSVEGHKIVPFNTLSTIRATPRHNGMTSTGARCTGGMMGCWLQRMPITLAPNLLWILSAITCGNPCTVLQDCRLCATRDTTYVRQIILIYNKNDKLIYGTLKNAARLNWALHHFVFLSTNVNHPLSDLNIGSKWGVFAKLYVSKHCWF